MTDKKIKTIYKPLFIWTLVVAILVIAMMTLNILSLSERVENYKDNYERSCGLNEEKICIPLGYDYETYSSDQRAIIVEEDEDYITCDTDRFEEARCVPEDYSLWATCEEGDVARCIDEDEDWTSCSSGEEARCVKEDRAGIVSELGRYTACSIGENAVCIDYDKESICRD